MNRSPDSLPLGVPDAGTLADAVARLRNGVLELGRRELTRLTTDADAAPAGVVNLAQYLALRSYDLRGFQRQLMVRGLTSLGRLESRVLPTIDALLHSAEVLAGRQPTVAAPNEETFFAGEASLRAASEALFGPQPAQRLGRIMVTLPAEAADQPGLVLAYVRAGMDIARINCAHDDSDAWRAIAHNVHNAARRSGRHVQVHMDISGPKIRTESVAAPEGKARMGPGAMLRLIAAGIPRSTRTAPFSALVPLPELFQRLRVGHRVAYDDGKVAGTVVSISPGKALVRVHHARTGGARLKPEKGLNFPDTSIGLSPLTSKDHSDLDTVMEIADIVGYSFVSAAEDIDLLEDAIAARGSHPRPLGLVAKIERPDAVQNLPSLIARAVGRRPFGVMIARGDLAAEIGFERLAEMQEEILWICEAAYVPVIWATQVLEDLVKDGVPSRGEMTDAAMATRAECVMLNKGPEVTAAITLLDHLYRRMEGHQRKKTPTLRALRSFGVLPTSIPESRAQGQSRRPRGTKRRSAAT